MPAFLEILLYICVKTNQKYTLIFLHLKGVDLEVKTKYMLMSHYQKAGQKHSIKVANRSFEDVAKFRYLGKHWQL
jgi:methyltransferase-like protein